MKDMTGAIKWFGASLDPANSPERLDLKRTYASHLVNASEPHLGFSDPYDAIKTHFREKHSLSERNQWVGKLEIDSWLTPKPSLKDLPYLNPLQTVSFMENNGCWDYSLRVSEFIENQILPNRFVMIGVDHSLSGGALIALAKRYRDLNVVVMDAHFDVMTSGRLAPVFGFQSSQDRANFYQCGNFLSILLEREVIAPDRLWVIGVAEENLGGEFLREVDKWIGAGVHVLTRDAVARGKADVDLNGPTYVSIDMDIGSLASVYSARYMNCHGLGAQQFVSLISQIKRSFKGIKATLVGMDIMELDIHFLEIMGTTAVEDHTMYLVENAIEELFPEKAELTN